MKPTQEQVIAWTQIAGMERCDCEPRCHLHTGGMGSLTTLATLAYEAGRKDENEACAQIAAYLLKMPENDISAMIRRRREQ